MLYYTASPCLLGIGKPLYDARGRGVRLVIVFIGLIAGFQVAGVLGAIIAISFSDLFSYSYICYGLQKESLGMLRQDTLLTLLLIGTLTVTLLLRWTLGLGYPLHSLMLT